MVAMNFASFTNNEDSEPRESHLIGRVFQSSHCKIMRLMVKVKVIYPGSLQI